MKSGFLPICVHNVQISEFTNLLGHMQDHVELHEIKITFTNGLKGVFHAVKQVFNVRF